MRACSSLSSESGFSGVYRTFPEFTGIYRDLPETSGVYRDLPEAFSLPYQQRAQATTPNMASEWGRAKNAGMFLSQQ
jgi:hypothetical protein